VVAPLAWGDELSASLLGPGLGSPGTLACDDPTVPSDEGNLVLKAARSFATATGWSERVHFKLQKRIPMGAGLGGGSSNGVAALRALNQLAGNPLAEPALATLATGLGSDCALFLAGAPVIMRGRGERIEVLGGAERARLSGRRVLVFKPAFGVATPWAYRQLAARSGSYQAPAEAEARLAAWRGDPAAPVESLLGNTLETPVFAKHLALPALLGELRRRCGLAPRMSGSGSACYALLPEGAEVPPVAAIIREAWGRDCFLRDTVLA
jgi:4-diphosphocytidyl-2-C-methyl-D-erythritol kinase